MKRILFTFVTVPLLSIDMLSRSQEVGNVGQMHELLSRRDIDPDAS